MIVLKALGFVVVWIFLTCMMSLIMAVVFGGMAYFFVSLGVAHSEVRVGVWDVWPIWLGPAIVSLLLTAALYTGEGEGKEGG